MKDSWNLSIAPIWNSGRKIITAGFLDNPIHCWNNTLLLFQLQKAKHQLYCPGADSPIRDRLSWHYSRFHCLPDFQKWFVVTDDSTKIDWKFTILQLAGKNQWICLLLWWKSIFILWKFSVPPVDFPFESWPWITAGESCLKIPGLYTTMKLAVMSTVDTRQA